MPDIFNLSRILGLAAIAFIFALAWTPILIYFLDKYRLGKQIRFEGVPIFAKLHKKKEGTPTIGGVLIWGTVLVLTLLFWALAQIAPGTILERLNFLSRGQTL